MQYHNLRNLFHRDRAHSQRPPGLEEAAAERQLAEALGHLRAERPDPETPLAFLRTRVEAQAASAIEKEQSFMATLKLHITRHPRMTTGLALIVALVAFVTLVPFPYEQTVGYTVNLKAESTSLVAPAKINEALGLLGYTGTSISFSGGPAGINYMISGLPTMQAAREVAGALRFITGTTGSLVIEPVRKTISGSLYAQVRDHMATIEVDGTGKSDAEIEAEIAAKLVSAGFSATQATVTTNPDGSRQIQIKLEGDETSPSGATATIGGNSTK